MPQFTVPSPVGDYTVNAPDKDAAKRIARAMYNAGITPEDQIEPPEESPGMMRTAANAMDAAWTGLAGGATAFFNDEIGALRTLPFMGGERAQLSPEAAERAEAMNLPGGASNYEIAKQVEQEANAEAMARSPLAGAFGEAAGMVGATGPLAAESLIPRTLLGAAEGALYAEGADASAAAGAGIGGTMAAAAPPVLEGVVRGAGGLVNAARHVAGELPTERARRLVQREAQRSGLTPELAAQRQQQLGPEARLADLSEDLTEFTGAQVAQPGGAASIARQQLQARNRGQQGRLIEGARGEINPTWPEQFHDLMKSLRRGRKDQADRYYKAAENRPVRISPELDAILRNDAMDNILAAAENRMLMKTAGGQIAGGNLRYFDQVKKLLDDKISVAFRKGNKELGSDLLAVKRRLVGELDAQVPEYAIARNIYSGGRSLETAAETGRNLLKGKKTYEDVAELVESFEEGEMDAFRVGAVQGLIDKVKGARRDNDAVHRLIDSENTRELIAHIFPDDNAYRRFLQLAESEDLMRKNMNSILANSKTASRQARGGSGENNFWLAAQVGMKNWPGAVLNLIRRLGPGLDDETSQALARMLLEPTDPTTVRQLLTPSNVEGMAGRHMMHFREGSRRVVPSMIPHAVDQALVEDDVPQLLRRPDDG